MGISKEYREFVRDAFADFGEVQVRPMFGGAGVYFDGVMFAMVTSDEGIYLKADDTSKGQFEAEGCGPFTYVPPNGDRPPGIMPYWQVPDRLLEDTEELAIWARTAHDVAVRTQKPKKPKNPKRAKPSQP